MEPLVTEAGPDDAAPIAALQVAGVNAVYEGIIPDDLLRAGDLDFRTRQWRGWLERSRTSTFVTHEDGVMTGFCTLHPAPEQAGDERVAEIAAMYVLPSHWRRGLGRALCQRALAEARARRFVEVLAWELDRNDVTRQFGRALGFDREDTTRVFIERADAVLYEVLYRSRLGETAHAFD